MTDLIIKNTYICVNMHACVYSPCLMKCLMKCLRSMKLFLNNEVQQKGKKGKKKQQQQNSQVLHILHIQLQKKDIC